MAKPHIRKKSEAFVNFHISMNRSLEIERWLCSHDLFWVSLLNQLFKTGGKFLIRLDDFNLALL